MGWIHRGFVACFRVRARVSALALAVGLAAALPLPVVAVDVGERTGATVRPSARQWQAFDAFVETVRQRFDVPGIAVAIVADDQVLLAKGYGLREIGRPEPVDARTMFAIASNTKAFTAAALSILADEGRLTLDDRVIDHLPWFRMSDPYVTAQMRLRDLLTHRSGLGLGAGDLLYWPATSYSAREVVERLAHVPLAGSFRDKYAYDNILYGVAQQVIEQVGGQGFKPFLQRRIFDRLGMRDTRYNADDLAPGDNVASGHAKFDFKHLRPVGTLTWHNVSGAGGLYSSAEDMAKWMRVQLNGGVISGTGDAVERLFSERRQLQMWSMVTPIPVPKPAVPGLAPAMPNFAGYGEGWSLSDYRGDKLVWHTGGWPGMVSRLTLMPGRGLGVVVLTNQEVGAAFNAITYHALDLLTGAPEHDWIGAHAAALAKSQDEAETAWNKHRAARVRSSKPSLPLSAYAGRYRDRWYGDVDIRLEDRGRLVIQFSKTAQLLGDLEHWQQDTFVVRWRDRSLNADAFVSFALDPDAKVREARMQAISPLTDFSFDFQDLRLIPLDVDAAANGR